MIIQKNYAYLDFSSQDILDAIFNQYNGKAINDEGKVFFNLRKNYSIHVDRIDKAMNKE